MGVCFFNKEWYCLITPNPDFVFFSRQKIELEFDKIKQFTKVCNKWKSCCYCSRAEYIDFETDYASNKNVDSWKKRFQGRYNTLVTSSVFNY